MENSRFEKESYFHVLVFYWLFYKRNRKHFFQCSHNVIETVVEVWENSKLRGNTCPAGLCCHCNFSFSQTCTCVSKTVMVRHRKCFLNVFFRCALVPSQSLLVETLFPKYTVLPITVHVLTFLINGRQFNILLLHDLVLE